MKQGLAQSTARLFQASEIDCNDTIPEKPAPVVVPVKPDCEDDLDVDLDWCPAQMGEGNTSLSHGHTIRKTASNAVTA